MRQRSPVLGKLTGERRGGEGVEIQQGEGKAVDERGRGGEGRGGSVKSYEFCMLVR